jgi:small subunit ribosomal protein S6
MRYELALLFKPLSNEDIKERILPKISKSLEKLNGSIKSNDFVGRRMLAYDIDSNKEGYYVFSKIEVSSANAVKFQKELATITDILRFSLFKESSL